MNWVALGISEAAPVAARSIFVDNLVTPIRKVACTTIDEGAIFEGILLPGSISDHVASEYDKVIFQKKTLQDLPSDAEGPRFIINATNVQSGVLMRFSKLFMRDYRVGQVLNPALPLARAVAASSAFPPVLSPCEIDLAKFGLQMEPADGTEDLHDGDYTKKLVLTDGGVYDNLGLETVWKAYDTVFVSDGGGHYEPQEHPHTEWVLHAKRVLDIIDSQVGSLRTRQVIALFRQGEREGTYWGIRQALTVYSNPTALACEPRRASELAAVPTRLKKLGDDTQCRLINWGYAICDASLRRFGNAATPAPVFPYPGAGI
jgi:NTE family protein